LYERLLGRHYEQALELAVDVSIAGTTTNEGPVDARIH
jgi:hypothetical protein